MRTVTTLAALGLLGAFGILSWPSGADAANSIPRQRNGTPDLSGIWQTTSAADYDLEPEAGRDDAPPSVGVIEGGAILICRRRSRSGRRTLPPEAHPTRA